MPRNFTGFLSQSAFVVVTFLALMLAAPDARAAGSFKLKSTEVSEVSGAWHIFVTIELPRAPAIAHTPIKFLFTKTAVYERALIDNHEGPVTNRQSLVGQTPSIESLDVDFADGSGKIFKGTRFDFGLTRQRGYEAGEYKVQVRTSDGTDIGGSAQITLKGENAIVDRRAMTFNAKEKSIKKVDTGVDGGLIAKSDNSDVTATAPTGGDVTASGTAAPFIPADAYNKTPEEQGLKEHPKGCGCSVPGMAEGPGALLVGLPLAALALVAARRRSRAPR